MLIAQSESKRMGKKKKKKRKEKEKSPNNKKNLPGLLKYDPAAKTLFRICTENHNYCCGSHKYSFWKEINIDIFSTDRTPLISPNLHIILFREGKPDANRTEKKKTFPIKMPLHWKRCSLHSIFIKRTVNKPPEKTVHWHQYCYSQVTFFSLKQFRGSASTPAQAASSMTFLQLLGNTKNAEDTRATEVMQKYSTMTTTTVPFSHTAASRSS